MLLIKGTDYLSESFVLSSGAVWSGSSPTIPEEGSSSMDMSVV
jgi:hypothetical protein